MVKNRIMRNCFTQKIYPQKRKKTPGLFDKNVENDWENSITFMRSWKKKLESLFFDKRFCSSDIFITKRTKQTLNALSTLTMKIILLNNVFESRSSIDPIRRLFFVGLVAHLKEGTGLALLAGPAVGKLLL